jgi:hypothetical protein
MKRLAAAIASSQDGRLLFRRRCSWYQVPIDLTVSEWEQGNNTRIKARIILQAILLQGIEIRHKLLKMVLFSCVGHAHVSSLGVVGTAT